MSEHNNSFEAAKLRLDEIVDAVSTDDISLDDALDLYEEAVKLGMQVSTMIEEDISANDVEDELAKLNGEADTQEEASKSSADSSTGAADPIHLDNEEPRNEEASESDLTSGISGEVDG